MRDPKPVSVLMPVCNEASVIRHVVAEWQESVFARLPAGSELVLDDCSDDGTFEILQDLARRLSFLRVQRSPRDGFFNSALRLYRLASNDLIFFTDSDGQYLAADFWEIYRWIESYDMVHGYKCRRCDPIHRKTGSWVFNVIARGYLRSSAWDVNSAFRLIHREALNAVLDSVRHLRMMPNAELYLRLESRGHTIRNVPVRHRPRMNGPSRSLPFTRFLIEGGHALAGLRRLKSELTAAA